MQTLCEPLQLLSRIFGGFVKLVQLYVTKFFGISNRAFWINCHISFYIMPAKGSQENATNVIRNSMKCAFLTLSTQVIWNNQNTTIIGGYIGVYNAHNIYRNVELDPLTHLSSTQPRSAKLSPTQINENLWKSLKKIYENR